MSKNVCTFSKMKNCIRFYYNTFMIHYQKIMRTNFSHWIFIIIDRKWQIRYFNLLKFVIIVKKIKIYKNEKQKLLKSMFIFDKYFQNIKINFIISLSKCKQYNRRFRHIMIIIDKLSKKKKILSWIYWKSTSSFKFS